MRQFRELFIAPCLLLLGVASAAAQETVAAESAVPLRAHPGECYARVSLPPQFREISETVLRKAASERIVVTPERYDWVDEQVMVKPASERVVEVAPARYRWEEQQVVVKPASERIEQIPATYKTVTERQLVRPATQEWKRGRGLVEKVDNLTGDILCLVDVPAEYRDVSRSEVDQPASSRRVAVPEEVRSLRRQVLEAPAQTRVESIPAEYQTVRVRRLAEPAREERVAVPAEYQTLKRQEKIADGRMEWRSVLCETNATPQRVRELQQALQAAGYPPGKIDGRLGAGTVQAVDRYQAAVGLPRGAVTLETLQRLGVSSATPVAASAP